MRRVLTAAEARCGEVGEDARGNSACEAQVAGLQNGARYRVRVSARPPKAAEASALSNEMELTPVVPPAAPYFRACTPGLNGEVKVQFAPSSDDGGGPCRPRRPLTQQVDPGPL